MLDWEKLLNDNRLKDKHQKKERSQTSGTRLETERDFDRILFATPTRRLADKTQVFPMEPNDSVRNRLTHSHEVANLARSIGTRLAFVEPSKVFGAQHESLQVNRKVPALLAAIGLAHDLGNPPFGHQGEKAISGWFQKLGDDAHIDFTKFDGNPQTFRLLTKLQILNDSYGLNLTFGTLAALLKYPSLHDTELGGYKKFGVFESERAIVEEVWQETGLESGLRHPLAHIMEACDDMAYAVIDAEDTVKKGHASFYDLIDKLREAEDDEVVKAVVTQSLEDNKAFKKEKLSSGELNEVSMQKFRVYALYSLVEAASDSFIDNIDQIMSGANVGKFELIEKSKAHKLSELLQDFARIHGFQNKEVLRLELSGNNYLIETMDLLWQAITEPEEPFARYATSLISENYRRVRDKSTAGDDMYRNCQLLADTISGMTEKYLIKVHGDLKELVR